jgi:hypothetical protein
MKKWRVGGGVSASTYVGEFEAATWQEAIEKAYKVAGVSVCHECAEHISDPEIDHLWAEDEETGDCTSEPTLSDQVSEQRQEIERYRRALAHIADTCIQDPDTAQFAARVLDGSADVKEKLWLASFYERDR